MGLILHPQVNRQLGQGLVEYALILTCVAIIMVIILIALGNQYMNLYQNIEGAMARVF